MPSSPFCLRVVLHCFLALKVLGLRVGILSKYRQGHALRIKLDRNGQTAIELSLEMRLAWASRSWMTEIRDVALEFAHRQHLLHWGVLFEVDQTGAAVEMDDPARAAAEYKVDDFMLTTFETMARTFIGLHTRSHALWMGGVYHMVRMCASDESLRRDAIRRGQALWLRIVAMEHLVTEEEVDQEIIEFANGYLWHRNPVYRDTLVLLSENRLDQAAVHMWRVHSATYHEKGNKIRCTIAIVMLCDFMCSP